jgi:N-acetylmuramoyl-L-alanine amidase
VRKLTPAVLLLLAAGFAMLGPARSELTDEQKRQIFLHSREDIRPVPRASATPKPRPTPAARTTPKPKSTPRPTPKSTPKPTPEATPEPTPEEEPESTPNPKSKPSPTPEEPAPEAPPKPTPESTPRPTPEERAVKATPKPTAKPKDDERPKAPIVIEKSGKAEDEGFVAPPPKRGWSLFGGGPKYTYLTASVRAAIDNVKVKKGRWKYIIIHNSGTRQGNARAFDIYHRKVRKMQNGLAYHFVIGNGSSSGNGEIEIGNRWTRQINGGHVASDYLNNIALGICFVGDFNRDVPTKAQTAALKELIDYLRKRCGRIKVEGRTRDIAVLGHKQINPKPTDCPGNRFPLKWLNSVFKN